MLDGPNVHFGKEHSVSVVLKIPLTRDFSHCSALAVTHETKSIPEIHQIKELLEGIGKDLKNSYQKMIEYHGVFELLQEDILEFEVCPSTRWTYLRKAGIKLIDVYFELVVFFENRAERHLSGETADPTAEGRLRSLKDLKVVTCLHVAMDILEPVIALNTRTQGRKRLICEKRHNVQTVIRRLEALKQVGGTYEKQLLEQLDFSEEYPKLVLKNGEVELRKLPGHIIRGTRSVGQETELRN